MVPGLHFDRLRDVGATDVGEGEAVFSLGQRDGEMSVGIGMEDANIGVEVAGRADENLGRGNRRAGLIAHRAGHLPDRSAFRGDQTKGFDGRMADGEKASNRHARARGQFERSRRHELPVAPSTTP